MDQNTSRNSTMNKWAAGLIFLAGVIHIGIAPGHWEHARAHGLFFTIVGLAQIAWGLAAWRGPSRIMNVTGLVSSGGLIVLYLLARIAPAPFGHGTETFEFLGVVCKVAEGVAMAVLAILIFGDQVLRTGRQAAGRAIAVLLVVSVASGFATYGGARAAEPFFPSLASEEDHHPELPERILSAQTLEEEYGVQVSLVAVTAAGGLVDVRYRIVDSEKAEKLVHEEDGSIMPMVYVYGSDTMLIPDIHMRTQQLIKDRMYFTLIPNSQNAVQRGAVVTIVFGDVALEPVIAK